MVDEIKPNVEQPKATDPPVTPPPAVEAAPKIESPIVGFFSRFEAPELQIKVLGILLGALALAAALLAVLRITAGPENIAAPVAEESGTYTGLEPDVPLRPPAPAPKAVIKKKAAPKGREWIERSEGPRVSTPPTSGDPAPPPVRASSPKEYVPGEAAEFLSEIKASVPALPVATPSVPPPPPQAPKP